MTKCTAAHPDARTAVFSRTVVSPRQPPVFRQPPPSPIARRAGDDPPSIFMTKIYHGSVRAARLDENRAAGVFRHRPAISRIRTDTVGEVAGAEPLREICSRHGAKLDKNRT